MRGNDVYSQHEHVKTVQTWLETSWIPPPKDGAPDVRKRPRSSAAPGVEEKTAPKHGNTNAAPLVSAIDELVETLETLDLDSVSSCTLQTLRPLYA